MKSSNEVSPLERYYVAQVASVAGRTFGRGLQPAALEAFARAAVAELIQSGVKLTSFLPELALRAVRDAVERPRAALAA